MFHERFTEGYRLVTSKLAIALYIPGLAGKLEMNFSTRESGAYTIQADSSSPEKPGVRLRMTVRPVTENIQAQATAQSRSDALRAQTVARIDALIRAERDLGRRRSLDRARDVALSLTGESRPDLVSYDSAIERQVSNIERLCSTGSGPQEIDACVAELARTVAVRNESLKLRS